MKALVLEEYNRFAFKEVPTPEAGPGEVLIAVKACGICGSDVHGMDGSSGRRQPPIIMGHEAAGIITEVGSDVHGWEAGQRVTFDSTIYCGSCWHCRRGEINLCDNRRVLGVSCDEYRQHGAFAEYVAVPARVLYTLPAGVSFPQAAMVEALSIAVHGIRRIPIVLNDSALVVGAGNIGLLAIQVLKAFGCNPVIAADIDAGKLEWARKLGADLVVNSRDAEVGAEVRKHVARGVDVAVEAVGVAGALGDAVAALRKGGSLALIGNISPSLEFPLQSVVTREISVNGSCASSGEYPVCLELLARGAVDVDTMISAVAPLSEGSAWFERLHRGEPQLMKVVLVP
ncbi:MAG: galactitol-1-phosphate 5-dehydrogenase [Spirochaetaceae bacterium]|nr:MAG: galactitol-1-phosphate 5-dehydrogenase [Spirochaetaceae bacterium]